MPFSCGPAATAAPRASVQGRPHRGPQHRDPASTPRPGRRGDRPARRASAGRTRCPPIHRNIPDCSRPAHRKERSETHRNDAGFPTPDRRQRPTAHSAPGSWRHVTRCRSARNSRSKDGPPSAPGAIGWWQGLFPGQERAVDAPAPKGAPDAPRQFPALHGTSWWHRLEVSRVRRDESRSSFRNRAEMPSAQTRSPPVWQPAAVIRGSPNTAATMRTQCRRRHEKSP